MPSTALPRMAECRMAERALRRTRLLDGSIVTFHIRQYLNGSWFGHTRHDEEISLIRSLFAQYPPRDSFDFVARLLALVVAAKEFDAFRHFATRTVGAAAHCTCRAWANARNVSGPLQKVAPKVTISAPNSCLKLTRKEGDIAHRTSRRFA